MSCLRGAVTALIIFAGAAYAQPDSAELPLDQAISIAVERDPWFLASEQAQQAQTLREGAVASRPAPSLSVTMANLPVDSFSLHQEPMTQVRVGVAQALPRGESVALTREQHRLMANRHPVERRERIASVALTVTRHYINYAQAWQHGALINANIDLFEQLLETTASAYQSGVGKVRQQDVLDARLALVKLKEQRASVAQRQEQALASIAALMVMPSVTLTLPSELPDIALPAELTASGTLADAWLADQLAHHPSVVLLAVEHAVADKSVALAKQQHAPQWAVNGSYGYRADSRNGASRADFFSVGVTLDLPLFNQEANDSAVKAAFAESESIETRRRARIRDLMVRVRSERAALRRLYERKTMYEKEILPQSQDYAEATLDAYTAAQGSVETVLDARRTHLEAEIALLSIASDIAQTRATLAYLTTQATTEK